MTGTGRNYDIQKIGFSYGPFSGTGFGDGDAIKTSRPSKDWSAKQLSHGEVVRSRLSSSLWMVTAKFGYTSPAVSALMALHNADLLTGAGTKVLQITDLLAPGLLFMSPQAWITGYPDFTWAREAGEIEFEFACVIQPEAGPKGGISNVIIAS